MGHLAARDERDVPDDPVRDSTGNTACLWRLARADAPAHPCTGASPDARRRGPRRGWLWPQSSSPAGGGARDSILLPPVPHPQSLHPPKVRVLVETHPHPGRTAAASASHAPALGLPSLRDAP